MDNTLTERKKLTSKRMSVEQVELIAIFDWFKYKYPKYVEHFAHIANESKRSFGEWNNLRKMGFKKGFSDIFISVPTTQYAGLFLEHKSKRKNGSWGKPTVEQIDFIMAKKNVGYYGAVSYGFDEATEVIAWYMGTL